ncbi:aromatic ring-hydroxylating dioxygenase subunit alpha [Aestuariicella hydrocarbonica]|uniref:Aromatic ring-hydroxylating dioxygenase subunit alpha n=1 Tax=Pseudomaricurvus hydrocarbonicus TaxID=1470433 RepID=A0A9E5JUJ5_9GAMM|nr:aromatic ring-hydroxylating dioxygenase subunit alpha [Aestuariicella hydrocarbonica]NHO66824.1 aromatic ring-hydroxylating dioxygenase subunit alpha [Aestuariicella hydrocarbonica]
MTTTDKARQQGDNVRCQGTSFQDLLDLEEVEVPLYLRENSCDHMGDEDLDVARWVSREYHDLEAKKLWPKAWQMACREEDIPEVGDHHVYEVINESVIITRSSENEIKGFINSCLHRGRLLRDEDGHVKEFKCPFHGATWDLDGDFKGIPCKWDFRHLDEKDMKLPQVKVGTWGGFVFINFDEHAQPLEEYLAPLPDHFSRYPLHDYYKGIHVQRVVKCNWKVGAEAFMESFHTVATHSQIMTFTGDANSQYDTFGDNISRSVTPMGVPSPHLSGVSEEDVMRDILELSGRMALNSSDGQILPAGVSARKYVADTNRGLFEDACGEDLSQATMAELEDAILYSAFPNFQIWVGYHGNIVYRFLPNGDDHNSCIFDIMLLMRYPKGSEKPAAVPVNKLDPNLPFSCAEELGALGPVFDQDDSNMPAVQRGMLASKKGTVSLATYQESRIRHLHQTIDKYLKA